MEAEPLTAAEIAEIRALEEKATPGPWVFESRASSGYDEWLVSEDDLPNDDNERPSLLFNAESPCESANWDFIAAARTAIPRLLATIAARDAEIGRLKARALELEIALEVALDEATGGGE